ncbi:hypothetical protein RCC89_11770 [Cytophagaceae bacterium ABcell3]|nr:hypothetical protein RCC89_11770 [Cytophagaceae bacterium ABcell3]
MKYNLIYIYSTSVFILLNLLFTSNTQAQKQKEYSGNYLNKLKEEGIATFQYTPDKQSDHKILNGSFHFSINKIDSTFPLGLIKKSYEGNYKENLKNDFWNYEYANLNLILGKVKGYNVTTSTEGIAGKLQGLYKKGAPEGIWTLREEYMVNGERKKPVKEGNVHFDKGTMTGNFEMEKNSDQAYSVLGSFDDQGFMNQEWHLEYVDSDDSTKVIENRQYENGFLLSILKQNKTTGDTISLVIYQDVIDQLALVKADTFYSISNKRFGIDFDNGYMPHFKKKSIQEIGNTYIKNSIEAFYGPSSINRDLPGIKEVKSGATRRFVYPLTEKEELLVRELSKTADSLRKSLNESVSDPIFKIYHQQSDSLSLTFSYFEKAISKAKQMQSVLEDIKSEEFRFKNIDIYYEGGIEGLSTLDSVVYEYDGSKEMVDFKPRLSIDPEIGVIKSISKYQEELKATVLKHQKNTETALAEIRKVKYSHELENLISENMDKVTKAYFGTKTESKEPNALQKRIYENFAVREQNRMIQTYSQLTDTEEKNKKGEEIIELQTQLISIHDALGKLPKLKKEIDEAYSYYSYNPYMGRHDIKNRLKPRLYNILVNNLWACFEKDLWYEEDYTMLDDHIDMLKRLHHRALELKKYDKKETRRLEKKLRREKDIDVFIYVLNI